MSTTNYVSGASIQYTNSGSAISSGDGVIITNLVGVAAVDIANGETGTVITSGVQKVPKTTGASNDWVQGEKIYLDATSGSFSTTATGTYVGIAWAAAAEADTHGLVRLETVGSETSA